MADVEKVAPAGNVVIWKKPLNIFFSIILNCQAAFDYKICNNIMINQET